MSASRPHTERWAYQKLYTPGIFSLATRLYPWLGRPGSQIVGRAVAWFYAVTQPAVRRVVRENLSLLTMERVTAADAVKASGGNVVMGPHEVPGGDRIIIGIDPKGAEFALVGKA